MEKRFSGDRGKELVRYRNAQQIINKFKKEYYYDY